MPDKIVNIIDSIKAVKGEEYAQGLVDMANLLAPKPKPEDKEPG